MKIFFVLFFLMTTTFLAQKDDFKIIGQIQFRSELDGRDFSDKTRPLHFATIRSRLGVEKNLTDNLSVLVQFQDARVLGQEGGPSNNIKNIDLDQAFVRLKKPFDLPLNLQIGRFQISYGTERFIGPSLWNLNIRTFSGARISFDVGANLDLFGLTLREKQENIPNPTSTTYSYPAKIDESSSLYGLYFSQKITKSGRFDLLALYDTDRTNLTNGENRFERGTFALSYFGNYKMISTVVETAYQFGKDNGKDLSAYLISVLANYKFNNFTIGGGIDINSGTKEGSKKASTFQATYGSKHRFFGFMDYFIDIPSNTKNAGINDFYLTFQFKPKDSKFTFDTDFHLFTANKKRGNLSTYGQEIDLTIKYDIVKGTDLSFGTSLFFPGDLMKDFFKVGQLYRDDPGFWTYFMVRTSL